MGVEVMELPLQYQISAEHNAAIITLNRPASGNALTAEMRDLLGEAWAKVEEDDTVRSVIVTGAGDRHFCTGVDLASVAETGKAVSKDGRVDESIVWSPIHQRVWKPVICALNGLVAGGGLHFVADSDLVLAVPGAAIMDTHSSVGMVGGVELVSLTHRLPLGSVLRMSLLGRHYRMSAERAHQLGLVDELIAGDRLLAEALTMSSLIARNSPSAVRRSKQVLWDSLGLGHQQGADFAWASSRNQLAHPDVQEGASAYIEKRSPQWQVR
jgi:E-phenylitaconyl-CoA hydratase